MKCTLLILGVIIVALGTLYTLFMKGLIPIEIFPNARTVYKGYVEIEPISLAKIKTKLDGQDCNTNTPNKCFYREQPTDDGENSIQIYPHGGIGYGYGIFFNITANKIYTNKEIDGPPSIKKFKEAIRKDIQDIGNIVTIRENTFKITKTKYPWDVVY